MRLAERLAQLIEALLDVSRIATGRLELYLEALRSGRAVREVVDRLREAARRAGCELSLTSRPQFLGNGTAFASSRC